MTNDATESTEANAPKRAPGKGKGLLLAVLGVVLVLVLLVLLLPTIISAGVGRGMVLGVVNDSMRGDVQVNSLSVGWFSGLEITGLELVDEDGATVLTAESVEAPDAGLLGLVMGSTDLGDITITRPDATVIQNENGEVNLLKAIESPEPQPDEPSSPMNYNLKLVIVDGGGSFAGPDMPTAYVRNLQSTIDLTGLAKVELAISADLEQDGQTGSPGSLKVDGTFTDLADASGQVDMNNATFDMTANVTNLPTGVIDVVAGQDGDLVAMIGPLVNASLKADGTLSNLSADFEATAQHLDAKAAVSSSETTLEMSPDSRVVVTVTPEAWRAMAADRSAPQEQGGTELTQPFAIRLTVGEFAVPKEGSQLRWNDAAVQTRFVIEDIDLRTPGPVEQLRLADTEATVSLDRQTQALKLNMQAVGIQGEHRGNLALSGDIRGLVTKDGDLRLLHSNEQPLLSYLTGKVQGSVEQFPLAVVDQVIDMDNLGQNMLGETLDAKLVWNLGGQAADESAGEGMLPPGTFELSGRSPRMPRLAARMQSQGENATLAWEIQMQGVDIASLAGGTDLRPMVNEVVGQGVSGSMKGQGRLNWPRFESAGALAALDASFELNVSGTGDQTLNATGSVGNEQIAINATTSLPNLNMERVLLLQSSEDQAAEGATAEAGDQQQYAELLGRIMAVNFKADVVIAMADGQLPDPAVSGMSGSMAMAAKNNQTDVNMKASIEKGIATFNDSRAQITLTPAYVASIMEADEQPSQPASAASGQPQPTEEQPATLALVEPAPVTLTIDQMQLDLAAEEQGAIPIAATVSSPQMIFNTSSAPDPITLNRLNINIPQTDMQQPFDIKGTTSLVYQNKPAGEVALDAMVARNDQGTTIQNAELAWSSPSAALIDAIASGGGTLAALLEGGVDNLTVTVEGDPRDSATFVASSTGSALQGKLPGSISSDMIRLREGNMTLTVTPQSYQRYQTASAAAETEGQAAPAQPAQPAWALADAAQIKLDIARFAMPRGETDQPQPSAQSTGEGGTTTATSLMDAKLTSDTLSFKQTGGPQSVVVKNLGVDLHSEDVANQATANGSLDVVLIEADADAINGSLTLSAELTGLASENARSINATIKGDQIPTAMLDALSGQDNLFANAIGPVMDLQVVAKQQGEQPGVATIDLKGDNATVNIPGRLEPDGRVVLAENAMATFRVTPQLGQSLARLNPVLLQARSGEKPVEVIIEKGAVLYSPGKDPNASAIQSISAISSINLNELVLEQGELMGPLLQALKVNDVGKTYAARFNQMSFKLEDGVLSYIEPMMMALGSDFNLGFDGNVNLVNKQLGLNMLVPAETMQRALGDNVPASSVQPFRIPLKGTYDQAQLNTDALVKQMADYGIRTGVRGAIEKEVGGTEGKVIGDVIDGIFKPKPKEKPQEQTPQQNVNETEGGGSTQAQPTEKKDKDVLGGILNTVIKSQREKSDREAEEEAAEQQQDAAE